jgi:hypothetical protein
MKKLLLLAVSSISMYFSHAQFTKGQKLFGPSFSFNTNNSTRKDIDPLITTDEKRKSFAIGIGFDALKFVSDKKAKGWKINYNLRNDKSTNIYSSDIREFVSNEHTIGLGYYIRNFIPLKPKLNFYYDIVYSANYAFGKTNYENIVAISQNQSSSIKSFGVSAFITPGFTYQVKKNLLIDAALNSIGSIGYFNRKQDYVGNSTPFGYVIKSSGFTATSSLSAGALLSNFWFSVKWIIYPKK